MERRKRSTNFQFPEEKFNYKENSYRHIRKFIFQMIKDERVPELSIPFAKQFAITKSEVNISKEYDIFVNRNHTTSENSKSSYLPSQFKDGRSAKSTKQKGKKPKSKKFHEQKKAPAAISQNKSTESNLLSPKDTLSNQDIKTNASSMNDYSDFKIKSETGSYQESNNLNPYIKKIDSVVKKESEEELKVQTNFLFGEQETIFYRQLLGPQSQNKTLSWNNMISQLRKFGWRFTNNKGGSAVTFHPPEWYLESQYSKGLGKKFVVHQSHTPSKHPMNTYIFEFLHSGLKSIGFDNVF